MLKFCILRRPRVGMAPLSIDIDPFFGPIFLLACFSLILYGLGISQVHFYFSTYRDSIATRLIVLLTSGLETVHAALCIHLLYTVLVSDYCNPEGLVVIPWSSGVAAYLESTIGGVVNSFYMYRIWRLSGDPAVLVYLIIVFCSATAVTFRASAFIYVESTWVSLALSKPYQRMSYASLSLAVLADLSITAMFLRSLDRSRSMAYTRGTKGIIGKLMKYALSSGIITAILAIATLTVFALYPSRLHYSGTAMVLTNVYGNAMFAMLNRRQGIKEDAALNNLNGLSLRLSDLPSAERPAKATGAVRIQVPHRTVVTGDDWFAGWEEEAKLRLGGLGRDPSSSSKPHQSEPLQAPY
ncbi:hypothetical protein BC629DRAFT_215556 [Irpex lacteus]|nr:hypothetical protein BC629DRAFT_215556 [Irpex lacteus]